MLYEKYIRVLYINLKNRKIRIDQREDLREYLGGAGIASKLLEENIKPDFDPLHEEQPVILAIGAASSIYPVVTKTIAMFYSPLTGELGESHAGGRLALTMLLAGYDAIVIQGKADKPVYITLNRNNIEFKDARALWGMSSDEAGRVIREREPGGGKRSILRIGPAGENMVSFASVCVDTYRHFGRLGLGAVFGSKNLKAVTIIGDRSIPIKNFKEYFKVYQEIYNKITDTEIMSKYHDAGTPVNVEPLNEMGGLPTKNLTQNRFEHVKDISGEAFVRNNLVRKMACTGCPVGCIHIGQFRREFDKGHDYESVSVGYDYELIFALGSFLGINSTDEILQLIEIVEQLGLDAMSTGVVLGWATEAYEEKFVSDSETLVPLEFGNSQNYIKAIGYLSNKENEFYEVLSKGAYEAARKYGGQDFAMTFAKNEMPGYHTGYGALVGAVVGARHSHLCNGGYSIDQTMGSFDKEKLVEAIYSEEKERCMLNSLAICLFARKVYDRKTILTALNAIGYELTDEDLTAIADRVYGTKLRIKKLLGFELKNVRLPKRFFETPGLWGKLDEGIAYELIDMYDKKIGEFMNK
ncbi:MAG TPA: aldehyde ferredoxin oxidoreductase C-terminal domain-containing protein [Clostridia bacterium]|nr:aldehyde ferredoxin oxidoreductase C-terminal domain-containing protein [Clostridia bacterium]